MYILFYCSNLQETRRRERAYRNNIGAFTIVKRVTKKVLPIRGSIYQTDGSNLGGNKNQRKECLEREVALLPSTGPFNSKYITKKFSTLKRGTRLTPERLVEIQLGIKLTERETELLYKLLYNREAVLTYDFIHLSRIKPKIVPPQRIRTILHEPQEHPPYRINPSLRLVIKHIVRERQRVGTLKPSYSYYCNPVFLVKKKQPLGKTLALNNLKLYRLINNAQKFNTVTLRDANLLPDTDTFSEDFIGCVIASLVNVFSRYDQIPLYPDNRDITSFETPLSTFRQTTIPIGATNSVA